MDRSLSLQQTATPFHLFSILITSASATCWAVAASDYFIPLSWLGLMVIGVVLVDSKQIQKLMTRILTFGSALLAVSLLQIVFRRQGNVLFSIGSFPLIFADGLKEAILLWIRYMILFMSANLFSRISGFEFLLFLNKIRIPFTFCLLLLATLKFIPFILAEARKSFWSLRFRGISFSQLGIKNKIMVISKILKPLLYRGMHYATFSALALELRGYGQASPIRMPVSYPLRWRDILVLFVILALNIYCVRLMFFGL